MCYIRGMDTAELVSKLRTRQHNLREKGVVHLAIFGSQARGDAKPGSDLDVLLDVPWGSKFSLIDLVGIEGELSEAVGLPANAFLRRSLDDEFVRSIEADVIEVF